MKLSIFLKNNAVLDLFMKRCIESKAKPPYNFHSFIWNKKEIDMWDKLSTKYSRLNPEYDLVEVQ